MEEMYLAFKEGLEKCFNRKTGHFDQRFENMERKNKNNQGLAGLTSDSAATS